MTDAMPDHERRLLDEVVAEMAALDAGRVRTDLGATWPRHRLNEVELEWRRWRVRRALGADDVVPILVRQFETAAVERGLPPSRLAGDGPATAFSYDDFFPQGPLVTRARPDRVLRLPRDSDPAYDSLIRQAEKRRRRYLTHLSGANQSWIIPDLVSAAAVRACRAEVKEIPPPPPSLGQSNDFSGGPAAGWDLQYDVLISESRTRYLGGGPALTRIHEDPALLDLISAQMGRRMYPTRSTYLPYRAGDYLGVHTDQPTCEVSLLFTLDGEPGPLRSYFIEAGHEPRVLDRWVRQHGHFPDGGEDYVYGAREGYALTGRAVPHARLVQTDYALIGALFFSGLG